MEFPLVRCLMTGIVIIYGVSSRNKYEFSDANNHILPVNVLDVADILSKTDVQGGCCNAPRVVKAMFELVSP